MAAVLRLTLGTDEDVAIDVIDEDGGISDLSGSTPEYTVLDDADVDKYLDETATATGLRIVCRMNTSATHPDGAWDKGHYRLFVAFDGPGGQRIVLGPVDVYLVDTNIP